MHLVNSFRFGNNGLDAGLYTEAQLDTMIYSNGYVPIATASEMYGFNQGGTPVMGAGTKYEGTYACGLDKKYVQVKNIDLTGFSGPVVPNLSGIIDGNELAIINFFASGAVSQLGLIQSLATVNSVIRNVRLTGVVTQSAGANYAGGICGYMVNGLIENCWFSGSLTSPSIGHGGICGSAENGVITNCRNYATINGGARVSGIIGEITSATVTVSKCVNFGNASASNSDVGGIVGRNNGGTIEICRSSGNMSTPLYYAGGIVGYNTVSGIVRNCHASGAASADTGYSAGLVGRNVSGTISNCYSTGTATGPNSFGFCALNGGTITNCYWDTQTSGKATSQGGTGKTTVEMQQGLIPDTTIYVSWSNVIWNAGTLTEYPYLN